jgi:hypothetical protein
MKFVFTPEEAQPIARRVHAHMKKTGYQVTIEKPHSIDAPYRTTLAAKQGQLTKLIEAQGRLDFHRELQDFARWLAAGRQYVELYIATSEETAVPAVVLQGVRRDGVGLLISDAEGKIQVLEKARNPALQVTPDPTLRYGDCGPEVKQAIEKFNQTDRKDGLRDLCEIVERETEDLALRASRRGLLKMDEQAIVAMDWSSQINALASVNAYNPGRAQLFTPAMKDDMHSFTRGRNLVDHKVRGKKENTKRERQFAERMMQGPRLLAELISLQRKVR